LKITNSKFSWESFMNFKVEMVKLIFISKSFYETNYTNIFESKLLVTLNAIFLYFITFSNLVLWAWPILISEYESTIIRSPILVTCNYQTNYQRTIIIHSKTSNKYFQFVWYTFRNVGFYIYILKKYKKSTRKASSYIERSVTLVVTYLIFSVQCIL
jgi:hypothetical protein